MAVAARPNIDQLAEVEPFLTSLVDRESTRYLIFTGDLPSPASPVHPAGGIDLGSLCVRPYAGAPGFFNRCLITPVIKVAVRRIAEEIPDGMMVTQRVRDRDAWGRPTDYVDVPLYPGDEAESLKRSYAPWGLREIEVLRGRHQTEVSAMRLNSFFFPQWPDLPETVDEIIAHLEQRQQAAKHDTNRIILVSVGETLLEAAKANKNWMFGFVEASHAQMSSPPTDPNYKAKYDAVDLHFLDRLGMQRRDQDLQTMVSTQELIGKVLTNQGLTNNQGLTAEQFTIAMQSILKANSEHLAQVMERTLSASLHHAETPAPVVTPPEQEVPFDARFDAEPVLKSEPADLKIEPPELDEFGQIKKNKKK
jgi:hypothetical protein